MPVCDINLAIWDEAFDGRAQKRCIMTGHWRNQQNPPLLNGTAHDIEMNEVSKGALKHGVYFNKVIPSIVACETVNPPVGLYDHSLKAPLCHLAPGCSPLQSRIGEHGKCGVGCKSLCCRTHPLIGVAQCFHQIITCHIAHVCLRQFPAKLCPVQPLFMRLDLTR